MYSAKQFSNTLNTAAEVTRSFSLKRTVRFHSLFLCFSFKSPSAILHSKADKCERQVFLSLAELGKSLEGQSSGGQVPAMVFGLRMALWKTWLARLKACTDQRQPSLPIGRIDKEFTCLAEHTELSGALIIPN